MKHNLKHAELDDKTMDFANQFHGYMTVTIDKKTIKSVTLPIPIKTEQGSEFEFESTERQSPYKVTKCSESLIQIEYIEDDSDEKGIFDMNFINDTTYWVGHPKHQGLREYFVRFKD